MQGNVIISKSNYVRAQITVLRDRHTDRADFCRATHNTTVALMPEAMSSVSLASNGTVTTPLDAEAMAFYINQRFSIVPIVRAGRGMVNAAHMFLPGAPVHEIRIKRDEKSLLPDVRRVQKPVEDRVPDRAFILDPMLATGGSAVAAISIVKEYGVKAVSLVCIFAVVEGIKKVCEKHPDVDITIGVIDSKLLPNGYIFPGCGDAGDRQFGTEDESPELELA